MHKVLFVGLITASAVAMIGPAVAARAQDARATFIRSCVAQMDMSEGACSCVADRAATQLDAQSVAYLEIQANNGPVAAAAAKKLSGKEIAGIDKFMRTVPDQCQKAK